MENPEVTGLKQVVSELPPHLPVLWAVYQKSIADEYFQDALGRDATDEEWQEIYAEFSEESDDVWGALAEVFAECATRLLPEEEEED
jgi:hypothetical protein